MVTPVLVKTRTLILNTNSHFHISLQASLTLVHLRTGYMYIYGDTLHVRASIILLHCA